MPTPHLQKSNADQDHSRFAHVHLPTSPECPTCSSIGSLIRFSEYLDKFLSFRGQLSHEQRNPKLNQLTAGRLNSCSSYFRGQAIHYCLWLLARNYILQV